MYNLFPLKFDIPDEIENKNKKSAYDDFDLKEKRGSICFLFSSKTEIKEIFFEHKNTVYFLGTIIKNEKCSFIYYIEVFEILPNTKIKMEIHDKSFFINTNEKMHLGKNFLFNQYLYDKEDKKIDKLNCFDIYEEFEIYYRIHFEKKNNKSLNWLISSVIINIKSGNKELKFMFFLNVLYQK